MNNFNELWRDKNSYDENKDYIEKILKKFNINKYNATINCYGEVDLYIDRGLKKYVVQLDFNNCVANVKRGKMTYVSPKFSKEYMPIVHASDRHDVWYPIIKWIHKDSQKV